MAWWQYACLMLGSIVVGVCLLSAAVTLWSRLAEPFEEED